VNDRKQAPRESVRYVMSLDMAYVNDQAVLSVCQRRRRGSRARSDACMEGVVATVGARGGRGVGAPRSTPLLLPPEGAARRWQTKGMVQRLRSTGVNIAAFVFSSPSVGRIARVLYRLVRDHAIAFYDDEALLTELAPRAADRARAPVSAVRVNTASTARTVSTTTVLSRSQCARRILSSMHRRHCRLYSELGPIPIRAFDWIEIGELPWIRDNYRIRR
jgi:hypothetical protein